MIKFSLIKYLAFCIPVFFMSCGSRVAEYEIVIYGGTSAGVIAAVQAARMNKSVIIIEPYSRLGGLSSGGLGQTDIGNKIVIGGLSREFYARIAKKYSNSEAWKWQKKEEYKYNGQSKIDEEETTMWTFEPKIALEVFNDLIKEYNIPVMYNERLDLTRGVIKRQGEIQTILLESGKKISGKVFIDASYEGDLMKVSGVSYTVGRESGDKYSESLNGVQTKMAIYHQFPDGVDPYIVKGDSSSGLLPGVNLYHDLERSGDSKVQAYCFRMCLTNVPENRISIKKPRHYNEDDYELLFRAIEAGYKGSFFIMSDIPNNKTDSNNKGPFSSDFIGHNYNYPEGDYEARRKIIKAHEIYQKGLLWTLSNHLRVPLDIRQYFSNWGLAKDEFKDNGNWTPQLYIRESRRMISDVIMTQHHCEGRIIAGESIGMGAYGMDSHHTQRYLDVNGFVKNEGDVEVHVPYPYPISYSSITPKKSECVNLFVPVCLAASHIAFGSIRMEPVFMVLGQSAAVAACMAIDLKCNVQDVPYLELEKKLLDMGQILQLPDVKKAE